MVCFYSLFQQQHLVFDLEGTVDVESGNSNHGDEFCDYDFLAIHDGKTINDTMVMMSMMHYLYLE